MSNDSYEQVEKVQNVTEAGMEVTFVNKLKLKSITVHKEWNDGNISTRPGSIQFKLLYRTGNTGDFTQYGDEIYTITEEDRDNGTPWSKVINDLPVTYEYKVEEIEAEGREGYLTDVTSDGDTFTITNTCTPYGVNSHRLLVRGTRVPYNGEEDATESVTDSMVKAIQNYYMLYLILGLSITILVIILLRFLSKRKAHKE